MAKDMVTTPSDVYSLAIVMWEILTGDELTRRTQQSKASSPILVMRAVSKGKRLAFPADANEKVRSIIEQSWHADPRQRPSCQQLIQSIKAVMQEVHVPSAATSPSPPVSASSPPAVATSSPPPPEAAVVTIASSLTTSVVLSPPTSPAVSSPPAQLCELTAEFALPEWMSFNEDSLQLSEGMSLKQVDQLEQLLSPSSTIPVHFSLTTRLRLNQRTLESFTVPRLCSMLRSNCAIRFLDLRECTLIDADVRSLFTSLADNTRLQRLNLPMANLLTFAERLKMHTGRPFPALAFRGEFDDVSMMALTLAIRVNRTLQDVELVSPSSNPSDKSKTALEAALDQNTTLCSMKIRSPGNPGWLVLRNRLPPFSAEEKLWLMSESDYTKYLTQLVAAGDVIADPNAFLRQFGSCLTDAQLRSVWLLADTDSDGRFNWYEQIVALHLISGVRELKRPLPQLLPMPLRKPPPSSLHPQGAPWLDFTVPFIVPRWLKEYHIKRPLSTAELDQFERVFSSPIPSSLGNLIIHPRACSDESLLIPRLCSMLRANCAITTLQLPECELHRSDMKSLLRSLAHNTHLEALLRVKLSRSAIPALTEMLRTNCKLVDCEVQVVSISDDDFMSLTDAIRVNPVLRDLKLKLERTPSSQSMKNLQAMLEQHSTRLKICVSCMSRSTLSEKELNLQSALCSPPRSQFDAWTMSSSHRAKHIAQFKSEELHKNGCLAGKAANAFLRRVGAGLTDAQLRSVWLLADIDGDGRLNQHEYTVACHLIAGVRDHHRALPLLLPEVLR